MNNKNGGQAFPDSEQQAWGHNGLTVRDYFAAAALQSFLALTANSDFNKCLTKAARSRAMENDDIISEMAYTAADSMLKEREK